MRSLGPTLSASAQCLVRPCPRLIVSMMGYIHTCIVLPGSFVAIYRILLNAFPLLFPANDASLRRLVGNPLSPWLLDGSDSPQPTENPDPLPDKPPIESRQARLSSAAQAHQTWLRQKSTRWHSIVAGAVAGGVAISFERLSRRKIIAQQLFVRRVILHHVLRK
jgi:hypothetical protein